MRGYDPSHRLQRGTTTETHLDVTYGDIVGKVAQRRGLQKGDGGSNTVVHEAVVQWNQTDWEFLSALAAEIGHEVVVVDGKLHLREPGTSSSAPGARRPPQRTTPASSSPAATCCACGPRSAAPSRSRRSRSAGWDYKAKEAVRARPGAADASRSASAGTGAATLAEQAQRRHAGQGRPAGRRATRWPRTPPTRSSSSSAARPPSSTASPHGNPALRAGVTVSLANVGAPFDGKYTLTSCRHTYDPTNGYQTAFRVSGRQTRTMLGLVRRVGARRRPTARARRRAGDRQQPRRPRQARPDEGHVPVARRQGRVALGARGDGRAPATSAASWCCPRSATRSSSPSTTATRGCRTSSAGCTTARTSCPSTPVDSGEVVKRALVSRNGHRVELDDKDDVITIATGDGKHTHRARPEGQQDRVETTGDVEVTARRPSSPVKAAERHEARVERRARAEGQRRHDRRRRRRVQRQGRRQAKVEGSGSGRVSSSGADDGPRLDGDDQLREEMSTMPFAARVGDPTGHPGVVTGPGCADRADRRDARRRRRRPAHVQLPAAAVHPPTPFPMGSTTVLIGGRPALRVGDMAGLRRADRHGRPDGDASGDERRDAPVSESVHRRRDRLPDAGRPDRAASPSSRATRRSPRACA